MTLLSEMLADSPAFVWKLDETVGAGTVEDSTANNRDGTVSGATLGAAALIAGFTSASFDGVDDRIHSATYDPFTAGAARTFMGLGYRDDAAATHGLFALSTGGVGGLRALTNGDIQWEPVFGSGAVTWTGACPTASVFLWHLTHNETTDVSELFVNGVSKGTKTQAVNYSAGADAFVLGAGANGSPWKGRLGFGAVFESVLAAARILAHADAAFPVPTPPQIHVREKPPLRHTVSLTNPSGRHYRWGDDEPDPANVPSGLRYSDTMPGGHESADATLPRKPGLDYPDLERLTDWQVQGVGGQKCWQGRLERAPRTSGDEVSVSPSAVGHVAALDDNKSIRVVYIDQDMSHWGEMTLTRKAALANSAISLGDFSWSNGPEGWAVELPNQALGAQTLGETDYLPGAGVTLARIVYRGVNVNAPAYQLQFITLDDAGTVQQEAYTPTNDDTFREITLSPNRRNVGIKLYSNGSALTPAAGALVRYPRLVAHGDHGLTAIQLAGDVSGYYASDVVRHAVQAFAPSLVIKSDSIQQSSFVIPHLTFLDPTTAGEIVKQASRFDLPDWGVWDDEEFVWHQPGARGRTWRLRIGPSQLEETGEDVARLWESVIVSYSDVDGSTRTVGPPGSGADTESSDLKDYDPDNPANKLGIIRRDLLAMGTSTAAGATEVGRRFLEQSKLLDRSGKARVVGWAEDDRGVLHPFSAVRSGDYCVFVDAADTSPRKIVRTDKDHDSRTCTLDLDAPPEGLEQLLQRLGVVLTPLGLG